MTGLTVNARLSFIYQLSLFIHQWVFGLKRVKLIVLIFGILSDKRFTCSYTELNPCFWAVSPV